MCLATPLKVKKIEDNFAIIDSHGHQHRLSLNLVKDVKVGDWILAHGDLVISKLPEDEAKTILSLIRQSNCHC